MDVDATDALLSSTAGEDREDTRPPPAKVELLARIYLFALLASLALSAAVAAVSMADLRQGGLFGRFIEWFAGWFADVSADVSAEGAAPVSSREAQMFQQIMSRLHPAPSLSFALLQVAAVVSISTMWFFAFTLRATRRHPASTTLPMQAHSGPVLASLLPVAIFVLAMFKAYQPAVLVMALVAILVAAEHYSGLTLQERELDEQKRQLAQQAGRLERTQHALSAQSDALRKQAETLKEASADLNELNKSTARLLSDAGLSHFVDTVYTAYRDANCIRAVVRLHEIDGDWWLWARTAMESRAAGETVRDHWAAYFESALAQEPGAKMTLAKALQVSPSRPELSGAFVTDLPMPGSAEWRRRAGEHEEPLFQDLLGLAWQLVVLHHMRATSQGACTISAWISRPLCWVHATDTKVFQVLRREPRSQSAVLIIADTTRNAALCSPAERESSTSLLAWAHDEIQRYVDRGTCAQEYIVAALRYAMIEASKYDTTQLVRLEQQGTSMIPRATDDLQYLLKLLGSEFWLDSKARSAPGASKIRDDSSLLAVAGDVFARLIHDTAASVQPDQSGSAAQLMMELL